MYVSNIDLTPNTGSCCIVSVSFFTAVFLSLVTFSLSLFFFFFFFRCRIKILSFLVACYTQRDLYGYFDVHVTDI